jgi:hypothetical protein
MPQLARPHGQAEPGRDRQGVVLMMGRSLDQSLTLVALLVLLSEYLIFRFMFSYNSRHPRDLDTHRPFFYITLELQEGDTYAATPRYQKSHDHRLRAHRHRPGL